MTTVRARSARSSAVDMAQAQEASSKWGWLLAAGIAQALVGILILSVQWTLASLAIVVGVVFIVRGIGDIVTSRASVAPGWAVFGGVVGVAVGIGAISWPGVTLLVLATYVGIWLIVWGMFAVISSLAETGRPMWWLTLISGLIAVPLGMWALAHPGVTLAVMVAVTGIWAVLGGIATAALSFEVRDLPERLTANPA